MINNDNLFCFCVDFLTYKIDISNHVYKDCILVDTFPLIVGDVMSIIFQPQPAEKQLAATDDLATNNPMRLLPIVAVLIAIVLLLVILAVIFVIIIRGRHGCANTNSENTQAALASQAGMAAYQKSQSSSLR